MTASRLIYFLIFKMEKVEEGCDNVRDEFASRVGKEKYAATSGRLITSLYTTCLDHVLNYRIFYVVFSFSGPCYKG